MTYNKTKTKLLTIIKIISNFSRGISKPHLRLMVINSRLNTLMKFSIVTTLHVFRRSGGTFILQDFAQSVIHARIISQEGLLSSLKTT